MEQLLKGSLSSADKELVKNHLDQCGLCSDALEGLSGSPGDFDLSTAMSEIGAHVREKYGSGESLATDRFSPSRNRKYYWIAAAAVILALFTLTFLLNNSFLNKKEMRISHVIEVREKEVPRMPFSGPENQKPNLHHDTEQAVNETGAREEDASEDRLDTGLGNEKNEEKEEISLPEEKDLPVRAGFEEYMAEEENPVDIPTDEKRYADIASTLPVEYYLAEVIVSKTGMYPAARKETMNIAPQESALHRESIRQRPVLQAKKQVEMAGSGSVKSHFFKQVESMPEFPGGYDGLREYLSVHLKYPDKARKAGLQGRVLLSFTINESGDPAEVTVVQGIGGGCDEEAVRVIKSMPQWVPAQQNGLPVPVRFTLPVYFRVI